MMDNFDKQSLWDRLSKQFSVKVLGGAAIIPESNEHYVVALHYAMMQEIYALTDIMARESDPRTASCQSLVDIGANLGICPQMAKPFQGYIKITGKPGAALRQNIEFVIGGKKFVPAQTMPGQMPPSGETYIFIKAEQAGPDGAAEAASGEITDPPANIDKEFAIMGNLCGGTEAESCEQFRRRLLNKTQFTPQATMGFIKNKILEWPCVTDVCENITVCCDPEIEKQGKCPSSAQLYVLFRGTFPCGLPPDCLVDQMNDWLFGSPQGYGLGELPFGLCGRIRYARPVFINIRISGLLCATAQSQAEISDAIQNYVAALCPSENLYIQEIETIIAQILGGKTKFTAVIDAWHGTGKKEEDCCEDSMEIDKCGNALAKCDYKICLHELVFVNMTKLEPECF